jgi:hypothetical protein
MIARRKDFKDACLLIAKSKRPTLEGPHRLPEAINGRIHRRRRSILAVNSKGRRNSDDCVTETKIAVTRSPLWRLHNTVDNSASLSPRYRRANPRDLSARRSTPLSISLFFSLSLSLPVPASRSVRRTGIAILEFLLAFRSSDRSSDCRTYCARTSSCLVFAASRLPEKVPAMEETRRRSRRRKSHANFHRYGNFGRACYSRTIISPG